MGQPWCGPIVGAAAVGPIKGVLPAALVGTDGPRAPDLAMSFAWDSAPRSNGYAGHVASTNTYAGDHGSMSRQEVHNVLIARGPSFKQGARVTNATGNVDIAPTVLCILGLPGVAGMDGRVLDEALARRPEHEPHERTTRIHEAKRAIGARVYRQKIALSTVGSTPYVNYGRASLTEDR